MNIFTLLNRTLMGRHGPILNKSRKKHDRHTQRVRLFLEQLEGRVVPAHLSDPFNLTGSATAIDPHPDRYTFNPADVRIDAQLQAGNYEVVAENYGGFAEANVSFQGLSPTGFSVQAYNVAPYIATKAGTDPGYGGGSGNASISGSFKIEPDPGENDGDPILVTAEFSIDTGAGFPGGSASISANLTPANLTPPIQTGISDTSRTVLMHIGDTIGASLSMTSTEAPYFGTAGDSMDVTFTLSPPPPVTPTHLTWNTTRGGVDYSFNNSGDLAANTTLRFYWVDQANNKTELPELAVPITVGGPLATPGQHPSAPGTFFGSHSITTAPPPGTVGLVMQADGFQESDPLAYDPTIQVTAKYGSSTPTLIGRYFSDTTLVGKLADDTLTLTLSDSLAALEPDLTVQLGQTSLNALLIDPTNLKVFETDDFDPATLPASLTPLPISFQVMVPQNANLPLDGTPPVMDVFPLPDWMKAANLTAGVTADKTAYTISGQLLDFKVGSLFTIPTGIWFAGGKTLGSLDANLTVNVLASMDTSQAPTDTWTLMVDVTWHGNDIYNKTLVSPGSGPFTATVNLDGPNLQIVSATFRYMETSGLTGANTIDLFAGQTFNTRWYNTTSKVLFTPSLTTDISITLDTNGKIAGNSYADLNLSGSISGSLAAVSFTADSYIPQALQEASRLFGASPPSILVSALTSLLQSLGVLPTFDIQLNTTGNLSLKSRIPLTSQGVGTPTFGADFSMDVSGVVYMTWLGDKEPIATLPAIFNQQFRIRH